MNGHSNTVSVVGGGWSVSEIDLMKIPGFIIAVNDSFRKLPRFDAVVSMDRLWTENRWEELRKHETHTYIRRSAMKNIPKGEYPWLHVFECDHESVQFSSQVHVLNGSNSGVCALNKAYQMNPHYLYLFGFDMQRGPNGEPYWYEPYSWRPEGATTKGKYREWAAQFDSIACQFEELGTEVYNVSSRSLIKSFNVVPPHEANCARIAA
jgi:hypothetical protein